MSQTSHLSRYRPAVIVIASVAAVASVFAIYTVYSNQNPQTNLKRSNAVHRPRRTGSRPKVLHTYPDSDAPLGKLLISRGDILVVRKVALDILPTPAELRETFGACNEDSVRQEIEMAAVGSVLFSAIADYQDAERRMHEFGLGGLREAIITGDQDQIRSYKERIALLVGDGHATSEANVNSAFHTFCNTLPFGDTGLLGGQPVVVADRADTESPHGIAANHDDEPSQGLKALLFYIAEEDAKRKAYEHQGIACEECGVLPIRGVRWHCLNCPDFDLCSMCEAHTQHTKTHVLAKIKIPLPVLSQPTKEQPIWYAGDPRKSHPPLDNNLKKRLCQASGFEEPQLDALYDQFCCTANVPWGEDPQGVYAAIDRRAFMRAFTCERWPARFAPNALYDRMFAFYDTNLDGLIGFEEFISGMSYLRGPNRFQSLHRALRGYDMNGDGFIDRGDFLRIMRAKYEIQKQLVESVVDGFESEHTITNMDHLRSAQPISAVFTQEDIPPGEDRPIRGKIIDEYGDMQPLPGVETILADDAPWPASQPGEKRSLKPHERLRETFSRVVDRLSSGSSDNTDNTSATLLDISRLNDEDLEDLGVAVDNGQDQEETPVDKPVDADVLWYVVEESMNELLDKIFSAREILDNHSLSTVDEREKWRKEIDELVEENRAFEKDLQQAAMIDPLMATALKAHKPFKQEARVEQESEMSQFKGDMVPTDQATLSKLEKDINNQSLDDLLASAGYSTADSDQPETGGGSVPGGDEASPQILEEPSASSSWSMISDGEMRDPTMPQNRPNTSTEVFAGCHPHEPLADPSLSSGSEAAARAQAPSRKHLGALSLYDGIERDVRQRGGPGRLRYVELEEIARKDSTREVRGLILSWLEWASF